MILLTPPNWKESKLNNLCIRNFSIHEHRRKYVFRLKQSLTVARFSAMYYLLVIDSASQPDRHQPRTPFWPESSAHDTMQQLGHSVYSQANLGATRCSPQMDNTESTNLPASACYTVFAYMVGNAITLPHRAFPVVQPSTIRAAKETKRVTRSRRTTTDSTDWSIPFEYRRYFA